MSDGLNAIDPVVATRWISEAEKKKEYKLSVQGRHRQEIGEIKKDFDKIVDAAEKAGIPRKYFLDELFERDQLRKIARRKLGDNEDDRALRQQLTDSLGGLPLGDWGVSQIGSGSNQSAAVPNVVPDMMTLAEAKEILAKPKGRGKPSKASITLRQMASKVVAEFDDGSHDLAEAMAEAIKAHEDGSPEWSEAEIAEVISKHEAEKTEEVEDLRPRFMQ